MNFCRLSALLITALLPLVAAGQLLTQPGTPAITTALKTTAIEPGQKTVVAVVLDIPEGFHAQSNTPLAKNLIPLVVRAKENSAYVARDPIYPEPHIESYPNLGELSVYTGRAIIYVPVEVRPDAAPGPLTIAGTVRYQICDDQTCFMPQTKPWSLETTVMSGGVSVDQDHVELFENLEREHTASATTAPTAPIPAQTPPSTAPAGPLTDVYGPGGFGTLAQFDTHDAREYTVGVAFSLAFLAGLLFNVMPCVLPVLPLKAIGFYEASHHNRGRSFLFGLVFSAGVVTVFGVLAVLVIVLRAITWGDLFSQPWFVWSLVILLVGMAFSLFGAFTFNLPGAAYGFMPPHDTFGGNFAWGALTAVLATPCTAPLLPPLLLWATTQPSWIGVPALIVVGVGMASPYLVLSAFPEAARRFPRTGPWAELFKQMMGFMLLIAATYFAAGRLVHGVEFWWVVVAMTAAASVFLVARTVQLSKNAAPLAVSTVLAVAMLGGTLWWTARVTGVLRRPTVVVAGDGATRGGFQDYSDRLFDETRSAGKPVLVKFTANWCATCQVIEGTVFQDPQVWSAIDQAGIVALKVDLTDTDAPGKDLLLKLNPAGGIPLTAVFAPSRQQPLVLSSLYTSDTLLAALNALGEPVAAVPQ